MRCWTRSPSSSDITNREVVQGIEETGLRKVPQQHKHEDSEECMEEIIMAVTIAHNLVRIGRREVIPT
jgi:response regulator of citrate/malate metabolism